MQIQNDPKRRPQPEKVQGAPKSGRESAELEGTGFKQVISASADQIRASLDSLMLDVDSRAQDLLKHPTSEAHLTRYTQSVRSFLRKAQGAAFAINRHFDRHNRLYMLVREVDSQLADLTDQVLHSQERALEMAARIQEIRGILLDMYI